MNESRCRSLAVSLLPVHTGLPCVVCSAMCVRAVEQVARLRYLPVLDRKLFPNKTGARESRLAEPCVACYDSARFTVLTALVFVCCTACAHAHTFRSRKFVVSQQF